MVSEKMAEWTYKKQISFKVDITIAKFIQLKVGQGHVEILNVRGFPVLRFFSKFMGKSNINEQMAD